MNRDYVLLVLTFKIGALLMTEPLRVLSLLHMGWIPRIELGSDSRMGRGLKMDSPGEKNSEDPRAICLVDDQLHLRALYACVCVCVYM